MKDIVVIGVGSPHGYDQLGWKVIDYLKKDHTLQTLCNERVRLIACDRPGLMLLEYIKAARWAILVDAIEGTDAGKIHCLQQDQLLSSENQLSSHSLGVAEVLKLGAKLNLLPEKIILYGVEAGDINNHSSIRGKEVAELARLIVDRIGCGVTNG